MDFKNLNSLSLKLCKPEMLSTLACANLNRDSVMKYCKGAYQLPVMLLLLWPIIDIHAQTSRTGTYLNSKAMPSVTEHYVGSDEINTIRGLVDAGQNEAALVAVQKHITELEEISLKHETSARYYAYNAMCTVMTSLGRSGEAVTPCTTAMHLEPTRWSAVNNRGTAHLVAGNEAAALEDYARAMQLAPEGSAAIASTIEHNINLARQRMAESGN
jgi:hypothetical protein